MIEYKEWPEHLTTARFDAYLASLLGDHVGNPEDPNGCPIYQWLRNGEGLDVQYIGFSSAGIDRDLYRTPGWAYCFQSLAAAAFYGPDGAARGPLTVKVARQVLQEAQGLAAHFAAQE